MLLKNLRHYIIPLLVAFFNILIIIAPNIVIEAAQNGLTLWFNKIIPSILPFLIGTNLLIHLGFIDFLGTLLEPFMKKFFNVSGCGAFALVLGMFSGYPIGAKITSNLRESNKITKVEAQRLASFTNNSGPLFIIGTVGIGMFQNIHIGYIMLAVHYISALTVGVIFRFYKKSKDEVIQNKKSDIKSSFMALKVARLKNKKTLGEILGDSVKSSLETIAIIGGFVVLFSVISELLKVSNIFDKIGSLILPESLAPLSNGMFLGIIEITNGANTLATFYSVASVIITCGIISFSGFSILAQTASVINKSDINMNIYILSKILHSFLSVLYCIILIPLIKFCLNNTTTSVFNTFTKSNFKTSSVYFITSIILLLVLALICTYSINYLKRSKKLKLR